MNTQANALPESLDSSKVARETSRATRPFYWSVQREVWENRSIYLAPLAIAAVFLFGFLITVLHFPRQVRAASALDPMHYREAIIVPYDISGSVMMLMAILVSVLYCVDALHGERRDRSILFWKSMPVSDLTTVLAKATIPIIVIPVIATAAAIGLQAVMLVVSSAVLLGSGQSVAQFWSTVSPLEMWSLLLYHIMTAHALWPAPIYAWLLLVSGWARRAVLLWAALPVVAIAAVELIVSRSANFATFIGGRLIGSAHDASTSGPGLFPTNPMTHVTPFHLLMSPGFWGGLLVTAIFLAAAVRLRRYRGPV
jgi:ABC-2 type transport system permease protein